MPNLDARIVEFLLNALWQIPLLALVALAVDRLILARCRPQARYVFWLAAVVLSLALPWLPRAALMGSAEPVYQVRLSGATATGAAAGAAWTPWWTLGFVAYAALALGQVAVRCVRLRRLTEETADVPLTYGSRVVLPGDFCAQASPLALRAARAHEETHLARRDFHLNLAVEILAIPVALHPAFGWMRRRLASLRELACDEQAARQFADPTEYAQGLVEAAGVLAVRRTEALSLGLFDVNSFEERIDMLTQPRTWLSSRAARLMTAAALTTLLIGGAAAKLLAVAVEDPPVSVSKDPEVTPPRLTYKKEPVYTEAARNARIAGAVLLSLVVNETGTAESIRVQRSLDAGLDQAAIDAVSQWQFEPARKKGQAVAAAATVEVNFRLMNEVQEADDVVSPRQISKAAPVYPVDAKRAGVQGKVVLRVVINEQGIPENIQVAKSVDPRLDQAAIDAVSQWRYEPGRKKGQAVPVETSIDINFTLAP